MVIDTMVIAHALLGVEGYRDTAVAVLEKADTVVAPDTVRPELANIVRQWARKRKLPLSVAYAALDDAEAIFTRIIDSAELLEAGLAFSFERDRPLSQGLLVAAAVAERSRVVSLDRRLQAAFPEHVVHAADYIGLRRPVRGRMRA